MNNMSLRGGRTSQCSSLPLSKVSLLDEGILLKRRLLRTPALVRLKPHGARDERSQRHMRVASGTSIALRSAQRESPLAMTLFDYLRQFA